MISEYGGGIKITSQKKTGTVVEVVFPLLVKEKIQLASSKLDPKDASSPRFDVLLIDDDQSVGEMIKQMLERSGLSVEYFSSSRAARDLLIRDQKRWKLVISDQIMPEIKGTDIYFEIREHDIDIPFFICSGKIDPSSEGIVDVLRDNLIQKPVDKELLLQKIQPYI